MRDGISVSVRFDQERFTFTANSTAEYSSFVVDGTGAHPIRPQQAKALRFDWPRAGLTPAFFRHTMHPGTTANTFWRDTLDSFGDILTGAQ